MSRFKDTLPLHVFIRRRQILDMYRKSLLAAKRLEPQHLREEVTAEIKREYRNNTMISDKMTIKSLMIQGKRSLETLEGMSADVGADSWLNNSDEDDTRGRVGTHWPWNSPSS